MYKNIKLKYGILIVAGAMALSACGGSSSSSSSGAGEEAARQGLKCLNVGSFQNGSFPISNICGDAIRVSEQHTPGNVVQLEPHSSGSYPVGGSVGVAGFGACLAPRSPVFRNNIEFECK